jgi:hypothetical protein
VKIVSNKRWDAIQQEFMKLYALGAGGIAIPQSFWIQSMKRMHDAKVLTIDVRTEENPQTRSRCMPGRMIAILAEAKTDQAAVPHVDRKPLGITGRGRREVAKVSVKKELTKTYTGVNFEVFAYSSIALKPVFTRVHLESP